MKMAGLAFLLATNNAGQFRYVALIIKWYEVQLLIMLQQFDLSMASNCLARIQRNQ